MVGAHVPEKIKQIAFEWLVVCILSLLFTFFAVYDSDKLSFPQRVWFWGSLIAVGWLVASLARPWVTKRLLPDRPFVLQLLTLSVITSLPIPFMLLGFDTGYERAWPAWNWALQYLLTFVIVILLLAGRHTIVLAISKTAKTEAIDVVVDSNHIEKFLQRLPGKFHGASLHAVSSEDHYLRVHTDRGDKLILMRLADALHELASVEGLQTHRSWWVARQGVKEVIGKSGKQSLILKCGTEVPIARSRAKEVRETLLRSEL